MLMKAQVPTESGNATMKSGLLQQTIGGFIEAARPESTYFTVQDGIRTMYAVFDLADSSDMPRIGEPIYMNLGGTIEMTPCMNLEELQTGLQAANLGPA
jgi:hypothetical protein